MGKKRSFSIRRNERFCMNRNPNGYTNTNSGDWPLYTYPERAHIVLDFVNKSTGVAHRADYCHFWEQYVPILLEEFGRCSFRSFTKVSSSF